MTTRSLGCLLLALTLPACDKINALIGNEAAPAEAKAEAKTDAKTDAKSETKTEAKTETKVAEAKVEAKADAPVAAAPTEAAPTPAAAPAEAVATAVATPCIVGRWKAIEYLAEVRRAIAKDPQLSKLKRSSSGGLLGYEVGPVTDGKGTVSAKAEALKYVFTGKVEGFPVTLSFSLDGEAEAEYTLVGEDTIVVAKPTKNSFVAKANAKVEGLGAKGNKTVKADHDFDGTFIYECTDKSLKVWRNKKGGEALDYAREGT